MADWTKITKETDTADSEPFLERGFLEYGFLAAGSLWTKISKEVATWTKIVKET